MVILDAGSWFITFCAAVSEEYFLLMMASILELARLVSGALSAIAIKDNEKYMQSNEVAITRIMLVFWFSRHGVVLYALVSLLVLISLDRRQEFMAQIEKIRGIIRDVAFVARIPRRSSQPNRTARSSE